MKEIVESVSQDTTVQTAARQMREANIGFLPVCAETGRAIGTLTDRDLALRVVAEGREPNTPVGDVMTPDVVSCAPDDNLDVAEDLMAEHQVSRIICVGDDGEPLGVISLSDLAQVDTTGNVQTTLNQISDREAQH
jgi:CBS domain-containing protein